MEEKILKKSYKILALAIFIFVLALIFVFWQADNLIKTNVHNGNKFKVSPFNFGFNPAQTSKSSGSTFNISDFPSPENFPTFFYPETKLLNLIIKCQDVYYTVLIFNSQDDYRKNPANAKFNQAFSCQPGEKIKPQIDLTKLNLTPGKYYYIIADQGKTGTWYNPR